MKRLSLPILVTVALTSRFALANIPELEDATSPQAPLATDGLPSKPAALAVAPGDTVRHAFGNAARERVRDLDDWMAANPTRRAHVATDRPLYRPGETVNFKVWDFATKGMVSTDGQYVTANLLDPRGTVVQTQYAYTAGAGASAQFAIDKAAPGGTWKLQVSDAWGKTAEREFTVASFQAPRIKKTLEFAREGYGAGDVVEAALTMERATGEKLVNQHLVANVTAEGQQLPPIDIQTDARGEAVVKFTLPANLTKPDVLLTVLVDDAGVTESISRSVPLAMENVSVGLFPEGGDLVTGLESRVYFEATDSNGDEADIKGTIVDDRGREVAKLGSWVKGRGHFTFTPQTGRKYIARVVHTDGTTQDFELPKAKGEGCVMHHFDDLNGEQRAVRVRVACTAAQDVTVLATQAEQVIDRAVIPVAAGGAGTTVHLQSGDSALAGAQGVARVTAFDGDLEPIAERLVYRNKSRALRVKLTPDQERYAPGDQVALKVQTTDPEGRPVPAEVAVSVVDDTLLSFADDDGDDLQAGLLLQGDLPEPIEGAAEWMEPGNADGGLAIDLALGTRGWRRFDWESVKGFHAAQEAARIEAERQADQLRQLGYMYGYGYYGGINGVGYGGGYDMAYGGEGMAIAEIATADGGGGWGMGAKGGGRYAVPQAAMAPEPVMAAPPMDAPVRARSIAIKDAEEKSEDRSDNEVRREYAESTGKAKGTSPSADEDFVPRSDFRDTVAWEPAVRTDGSGLATVSFKLSDAVTGFRATAEGVSSGLVGRGESLLVSTLPFHLEARLPVELSAGDRLDLPVTLENQRGTSVQVDLAAKVGGLLDLKSSPGILTLAPHERRTLRLPIVAKQGRGDADLSLIAHSNGLTDGISNHIPVAPRGFPQKWAKSGILKGSVTHPIEVPNAIEGSTTGKITVFPNTVSEVLKGIENMVRTPGGCFEQTSSTNYPNVIVLDLLEQGGNTGKLSVDRKQVLDTGYGILKGYQVTNGAFETWGSGPGKEALSAYGLLEFSDMSRVYEVSPKLLQDNVDYLLSTRTGTGGYTTTGSSAHGYGTAPASVLDAYITYALVETGHAAGLDKEIAQSADVAKKSNDPYTLSLATLALVKARPEEGKLAAARLAKLQAADGSFPGSETSITRSENYNLDVEATSLAAMALLRAGNYDGATKAVEWLHNSQTGAGAWGATQGNALALKAIGEVARGAAKMEGPGHLVVKIDGTQVAEARFEAGQREPVVLDLAKFLTPGHHEVQVSLDGAQLPYALETGWSAETPSSDPSRRVELSTALDDDTIALGHTTRLTAKLSNRTPDVVPEPIARIGLPAGLEAQTWQLEELKKSGKIAFFETRPREVTIYWDGISANEVHEVALDLVATVPGVFTGPASSAYPYYDDQAQAWTRGLGVTIAN